MFKSLLILFSIFLFSNCVIGQKMVYNEPPLVLTENKLTDALGSFTTNDLPIVSPKTLIPLCAKASPIINKMWLIALDDVEKNIITNEYGTYFAAGRRYTNRVYVRDISLSGILGLNDIFPDEMKKSLMVTRKVVALQGYKVSSKHVIKEIKAPWEVISNEEPDVMTQFKTNSITRRTDDVVWIWAADDLFTKYPRIADWQWLYTSGKENFKIQYNPWFDESDGLYRAQPIFQDLTSSGYPKGMTISDCVLLKATSTNCIYYKALLTMAKAAEKLNLNSEAEEWRKRALNLKNAIKKELMLSDGTFTYYKDRYGVKMQNQHNLGTAFAILFNVVDGKEAKKSIENYPITGIGTPLIFPFLITNKGDHNEASWPFCDTFLMQAKEKVDQKSYVGYNAAILARTMGTKLSDKREKEWGGFGSFHEKVELPGGLISGSGQQLWTSAAFINVCLRANLVQLNSIKFN
jgi:hypothetical protein